MSKIFSFTKPKKLPESKRSIRSDIIVLLAIGGMYGFKYLDAHFSSGGLINQANEIVHDSGCEAAMPTYDRAVSYGGGGARFERGNCEFRLNRLDAAIADYSEAIRVSANVAPAFYNRGLVYRALGKPTEALADWAEAARMAPADPAPLLQRARTFRDLSQFDFALQAYDAATKAGADADEMHLERADVMRDKGDYSAALAEYDLLAKADANGLYSRALFERVAVLRLQGDVTRAEAVVEEGLARWPKNSLGLYQRGLLELFAQNRPDAAAQDFSYYFTTGKNDMMAEMLLSKGVVIAGGGPEADTRLQFAAATPLVPIAYEVAIYLYLARLRSWKEDGAEELAKNQDAVAFATRPAGSLGYQIPVEWPAPVIAYLLGKLKLDDVLKAASPSKARICAANFVAGMVLNHIGAKDDALHHLKLAIDECPAGASEKDFANYELLRLAPANAH